MHRCPPFFLVIVYPLVSYSQQEGPPTESNPCNGSVEIVRVLLLFSVYYMSVGIIIYGPFLCMFTTVRLPMFGVSVVMLCTLCSYCAKLAAVCGNVTRLGIGAPVGVSNGVNLIKVSYSR